MAGRKDKNTVDYFPHYCTTGKTLFIIESKFGHLGYSVWFKTLELLGASENHFIDLRQETDLLFLVSKLKLTESELLDIYNLLAKLDAIDSFLWTKKIIFSENFIKNVDDAYKRRSNKCMQKCDLCKHLLFKCSHNSSKCGQKSIEESKVEESKVKKRIYRQFSHLSILDEENKKLMDHGYKQSEIDSIYDKIENFKQNNKYKSLYLTSLDWLKREHGPRTTKANKDLKKFTLKAHLGETKTFECKTLEEAKVLYHKSCGALIENIKETR